MNNTENQTPSQNDHGYCKSPLLFQADDEIEAAKEIVTFESVKGVSTNSKLKENETMHKNMKKKRKRKIVNLSDDEWEITSDLKNKKSVSHPRSKKNCTLNAFSQKQLDLLLLFLTDPFHYSTDENFHQLLLVRRMINKDNFLPKHQLTVWEKVLSRRKVNSKEMLCLKSTKKLILPREKYAKIIEEAHLGEGSFIWCSVQRDEKGQAIHNSYTETLALLASDYVVEKSEFGIPKHYIYEVVHSCKECSNLVKKLPPLSHIANDSTYTEDLNLKLHDKFDIDAKNESHGLDLSNIPLTMLWSKPDSGSIWYDQKGLVKEHNPYNKLLGVIQELGLELGNTAQGCVLSKERFTTKLYCAVRLIKEEKERLEKKDKEMETNQFLSQYLELQKRYVKNCKLDTFLYDVNLLALKYDLSKNELFMKIVNNCVQQFGTKDEVKSSSFTRTTDPIKTPPVFSKTISSTQSSIPITGVTTKSPAQSTFT